MMFQNEPYSKITIKRLFVCATRREAQPILDHYEKKFKILRSSLGSYEFYQYIAKKDWEKYNNLSILDTYDLEADAIIITGIGKINATMNLTNVLSRYNVERVINIGMCGGLQDKSSIGNLYRVDEVKEFDSYIPKSLNPEDVGMFGTSQMIENNNSIFRNWLKHTDDKELYEYTLASIASGDEFIDSNKSRDYVKQLADLCDMESYAIARVCFSFRTILYIFKMVSDMCNEDSPVDFYNKDIYSIYDLKITNLLDKIY